MSDKEKIAESEHSVEEAVHPEESENETDGETAPPHTSPDMGKVIAAVKKKFREKGYNEGLAAAQQERRKVDPASLSSSALSEIEGESASPAPVAPSSSPQVDPGWLRHAEGVCARGRAKYADFEKKLEEIGQKSQHNPTLLNLFQYALGIGDADAVYEIMNNPAKRARMLDDPQCWNKELFNFSSSQEPSTKVVPPPLDELKTAPAKGERSFADQRRYVLQKHGVYRGS